MDAQTVVTALALAVAAAALALAFASLARARRAEKHGQAEGAAPAPGRMDELVRATAQMASALGQVQQGLQAQGTAQARDGAATQQSVEAARAALSDVQRSLARVREQLGAATAQQNSSARATQRALENIAAGVSQMTGILSDKKSRGAWGEYQLETLLSVYAGSSSAVYEAQYTLARGQRVDVALHLPGTSKILGIDSKFPLEGFQEIQAAQELSAGQAEALRGAEARFRTSVRRHVDDIARKYVVPPETADLAVMFVPSEAVYIHVCAEEPELISYAAGKHVLICSPTTLVGVVFSLVAATRDFERTRNIDEVVRRIGLLQDDVRRLNTRLEGASKALDTAQQRFAAVGVSGGKVVRDIELLCAGALPAEGGADQA